MKKLLIVIWIILTFLLYRTCNEEQFLSDTSSFSVVVDSTFPYALIDGVYLVDEQIEQEIRRVAIDSPYTATDTFRLREWNTGDYTLKIKTIFSTERSIPISLPKDSILNIPQQFNFKKVANHSKDDLINLDTIEFTYIGSGCFHHRLERFMLVKDTAKEDYTLTMTSDRDEEGNPKYFKKKVPQKIIDALLNIEHESVLQLKREIEIAQGVAEISSSASTAKQNFYVLANNEVFEFTDYGFETWNLYENFLKEFGEKD
jgi:hypothetical protein